LIKIVALLTLEQAINDKILDFNYEEYAAEIKTADAQESYEKGVIVLVTGCLTGKDNLKRKFTQTFFLAPQDKGYFVLNDVFRYIEENEHLQANPVSVNSVNENVATAALTPEPGWSGSSSLCLVLGFMSETHILKLLVCVLPEPAHAPEHPAVDPATSFEEEDLNDGAEVCDPSDNEEGSVVEVEVIKPSTDAGQNEVLTVVDSTDVASAPAAEDDAPKKSYASIVSPCL
jgi:hypothetical protein